MIEPLETNRCRLVPLQSSHAADYIALANHELVRERVNNIVPYTQQQFDELLALSIKHARNFTWVIEVGDQFCGIVTTSASPHPQRFQGGYWIDPRYWGQGLATAAVKRSNQFLYKRCDAIRIQALVEPHNEASIAVLEKCGYAREGLLKSYYPTRYRGLVDVLIYAQTR